MKSPLMERPIFHHLENRTQTHIFLCVLAYHLLVSIEKRFLDRGVHTSWWTLRQQLSTHQVVTVVLPTTGKGSQDPQGYQPRTSTPRNLHNPQDSHGGHEAGENLARGLQIVTKKTATLYKQKVHSARRGSLAS